MDENKTTERVGAILYGLDVREPLHLYLCLSDLRNARALLVRAASAGFLCRFRVAFPDVLHSRCSKPSGVRLSNGLASVLKDHRNPIWIMSC